MHVGEHLAKQGALKRAKMLELVQAGRKITECWAEAGWGSIQGYNAARKAHPTWAAQIDHARTLAKIPRADLADTTTPTTFAGFVEKWFPDRKPPQPHQTMIAKELASVGPNEIVMILLWPEAGKTATLEDFICRRLAFDPGHRFRYVSEAQDLAKRVIGTCKRRFTDPFFADFQKRYGPFYEKGQEKSGKPWTTEQITLWKNPALERDYNIAASSWTSAVYGSRIDTLVLDDLQSQRNLNQAEDIFDRIQGTFFNRGLEIKTVIIGTRIGPGDFYERMLDAGLVTRQVILSTMDGDGKPKFPDFWDPVQIAARRGTKPMRHNGGACCPPGMPRECPRDDSILSAQEFMDLKRFQAGEKTWWASYMQQPQANTLSTFAEYLERCLDHDRAYGEVA